jgi:hypothetical protein
MNLIFIPALIYLYRLARRGQAAATPQKVPGKKASSASTPGGGGAPSNLPQPNEAVYDQFLARDGGPAAGGSSAARPTLTTLLRRGLSGRTRARAGRQALEAAWRGHNRLLQLRVL